MSIPEIRGIWFSRVARSQEPGARIENFFWLLASGFWLHRYPCFCLCFTFVQITRTTPLRRTILQFSQILLTLALTFMFHLSNRLS
jgi:hypothetical protein